MRERANRGPSFMNQMISEGRGQRNVYVIREKTTGKVLQCAGGNDRVSWAEVVPGSNVIIARDSYGRDSKTYKADEIVASGDIKVSGQK